ncbi:MAG: hypothetical protein WKG01_24240 [Kofleriaceae bacterium]
MALALWFAGFVGLIVAAAAASARGRSRPTEVAGRNVIAASAIAYVGVIAAATWIWSGGPASHGRTDRLREGASVDVTLRAIRVGLEGSITIGHGDQATVAVPGGGVDVLARIELDAAGDAVARATAPASIVGHSRLPRMRRCSLRNAAACPIATRIAFRAAPRSLSSSARATSQRARSSSAATAYAPR